jgi:tetratricopeptide (TPR) repeat protein
MKQISWNIVVLAGALLVLLASASVVGAQNPGKPGAAAGTGSIQQGLTMAHEGRCVEAIPLLKRFSMPASGDKELRLRAGMALVRCAMTLDKADTAVDAIRALNREFAHDPDVLYATTHAYSDLSTRASLELLRRNPNSYQAKQLHAEALEVQGKWDEAIAEYRKILEQNPNLPGIHFRLGRFILSRPETATTAVDAKKEFEEELKIDPSNAGAEYILAELSRQAQEWEGAIEHFARAAKLDPAFANAWLGLGMAYVSTGKFSDAVRPLENYVKMVPANPAGHYQLAIAYNRVGRKEDAAREAALQKQTAERLDEEKRKNQPAQQDQPATQDAPAAAPPQ